MTTSYIETITVHRLSQPSSKQGRRRDDPRVYLATAAIALSEAGPHPRQAEAAEASTETQPMASSRTSLLKSAKSPKCWQVGERHPIQAQEGVETCLRSSINSSRSISRIIKSPTKPLPNQISPT